MYKLDAQVHNNELLCKVSLYSLFVDYGGSRISAVVLTKEHCISILHLIPEDFRKIGAQVVFFNSNGEQHNAHIHGMNSLSDYVVFKKYIGVFTNVPDLRLPGILDQYISLGFAFADRNPSVRVGYISQIPANSRGFFYGSSGGLSEHSGGGVFYASNGSLMGIARSNKCEGNATSQYGDVLEIISKQIIVSHIEFSKNEPFSV